MKLCNWIVVDAVKQEMRCDRCMETEPLSSINHRRITYVVGVLEAFHKAHKGCKGT